MKFNNAQKREIRLMHSRLTSRGLFAHLEANFNLNCKYTTYRTALYEMGLYKCQMLRWTKEETEYLLANYKLKGNIEIAKNLTKKGRKFSKKQIEKKMKLLKIKRSPKELEDIKNNHVERGVYKEANIKNWSNRKAKEGDTRTWICNGTPRVVIKVNGSFIPYARHRYIQLFGEIPKGYKVYFKDMNPLNISDDNLELRKGAGLKLDDRILFNKNKERYMRDEKTKNEYKSDDSQKAVSTVHSINTNSVKVKINDKLTVFVKPGTDIQNLKQKYNQLRI